MQSPASSCLSRVTQVRSVGFSPDNAHVLCGDGKLQNIVETYVGSDSEDVWFVGLLGANKLTMLDAPIGEVVWQTDMRAKVRTRSCAGWP